MNSEKIKQIDNRIEELVRLSNGRGRIIDGNIISNDYIEEYSDLIGLKNILLENNIRISDIPYISHDDVMIREDLLDSYKKTIKYLELPSLNNNINIDEPLMLNEDNIISNKKSEALEKINSFNLSSDSIDKYKEAINNSKSEDEIDIIMNAANSQNDLNKEPKLIPGTKMPMPRDRKPDESIEEYEDYLKEHYRPYGYSDDNVINYPETNIPIPRRPYPHENDFLEKDSYYNEMLRYFADRYKAYTQNQEYTGPVKEGEQLAVIDNDKDDKKIKTNDDEDDVTNTNNEPLDDKEHEVTGFKKVKNFFKKHKKKIIIGLGLASLALAFVPGVAPAIMVANSRLWVEAPIVLKPILHTCNVLLSIPAGATEVSTGLWAFKSTGALINEFAASASLLKSLATAAVAFTGSTAILKTIGYAKDKIVNKTKNLIKNKINNKNKEDDYEYDVEKEDENTKTKDESKELIENDRDKTEEKEDIDINVPVNEDEEYNNDEVVETENTTDDNMIYSEEQNKDDNKPKYLVTLLNGKRNDLINIMENPVNSQHVIQLQNEIIKLDRAIDILSKGQNMPIINTIDFMGYRIDEKDKNELEAILNNINSMYKENFNVNEYKNIDKYKEAEETQNIKNDEEFNDKTDTNIETDEDIEEYNDELDEDLTIKEKLKRLKENVKKTAVDVKNKVRYFDKSEDYSTTPPNLILEEGVPPMPQKEDFENESYYNQAISNWYKNYQDRITIIKDEENEIKGGKNK